MFGYKFKISIGMCKSSLLFRRKRRMKRSFQCRSLYQMTYIFLRDGGPKSGSLYSFVRRHAPFTVLDRIACVRALKAALPDGNVPVPDSNVTRKTFATGRLRCGTNRQTNSELLGQQDTSSLNHYLYLDSDRMKQYPITLNSWMLK